MKSRLEAAVGRVREAIKRDDLNEIRSATEALNQLWNEAASKLYQRATSESATAGAGTSYTSSTSSTGSENVQDADFEVVDDEGTKK
jgi:molecular chaperone DnaK